MQTVDVHFNNPVNTVFTLVLYVMIEFDFYFVFFLYQLLEKGSTFLIVEALLELKNCLKINVLVFLNLFLI